MKRVVWSPDARKDLLDIVTFLAEDNPFAASRAVDTLDTVGAAFIFSGSFITRATGRNSNV